MKINESDPVTWSLGSTRAGVAVRDPKRPDKLFIKSNYARDADGSQPTQAVVNLDNGGLEWWPVKQQVIPEAHAEVVVNPSNKES